MINKLLNRQLYCIPYINIFYNKYQKQMNYILTILFIVLTDLNNFFINYKYFI